LQFFALIFMIVALYCLLAILFKLPSFSAAKAYRKYDKEKSGTIRIWIADGAKWLAPRIPMGMLRQVRMQKRLTAASVKATPQEYTAETLLVTAAPLVLVIPVYLAHPLLALLPAALSVYLLNHRYENLTKMGDRRRHKIEKELPRFVSYMANTLKSSRNVLEIMDVYRTNYSSPLTAELTMTVADIRTGNAEQALRHLQARINSPFMSDLVRGLLSAMRGDDMSGYFDNLSNTLSDVWEQRLKMQALKKEPKIMGMAYVVFACAMISLIAALGAALSAASDLFLGMGV
jgi:Flp pilus assembly protein TadB